MLYQEIEIVMHVVARLCNRQLRQFTKDIASKNLFEHLTDDNSDKRLLIKYSELLKLQKERKASGLDQ